MNFVPPLVFGTSQLELLEEGRLKDLIQVLVAYSDIQALKEADEVRRKLALLLQRSHRRGVWGLVALELLEQMIGDQGTFLNMELPAFTTLYRFVFFVGRDPGRKHFPVDRAIRSWEILLGGRFRLLDKFIGFVRQTRKTTVSEDTWRQVLDFSRQVHEDLSNYDPSGAWPVLLDEFVEYLCLDRSRSRKRLEGSKAKALDFRQSQGIWSPSMRPLLPSCGSKRRAKSTEASQNYPPDTCTEISDPGDIKERLKRLCIGQNESGKSNEFIKMDLAETSSLESTDHMSIVENGCEEYDELCEVDEAGYHASSESDGAIQGSRSTLRKLLRSYHRD